MKKQNWKALSLAALLLASASAFAVTPDPIPSGNPASTTAEIDAQMAITRRGIDEMMKRVGTPAVPSTIKASDYWRVRPTFEKNVDDALTNFESGLKKDVLDGLVAPTMEKYNSFYATLTATDLLSPDRKALMLDQQWTILQPQLRAITDAYKKTVLQAYSDLGLEMFTGRFLSGDSFPSKEDWRKCHGRRGTDFAYKVFRNVGSGSMVLYSGDHVIECKSEAAPWHWVKLIVAQFRKGCASQICVQLRTSDASTALSAMKTILSRNLEFKLDDGHSFIIIPPPFEYDIMIGAFGHADHFGIDDLPFDTP